MAMRRLRRRGTDADEPVEPPAPGPGAVAVQDEPVDGGRAPDGSADIPEPDEPRPPRARRRVRDLGLLLLIRSAHPRQAILTAVGVAAAGALANRPTRELLLILATVVVGQSVLGWFNDVVDRQRDARHETRGKPVADGRLDPGTVWFVLTIGVFAVVPLSVANGVHAGACYLLAVAVAVVGTAPWIRTRFLSWLPWAVSYALLVAFLSYGGWGGQHHGPAPEPAMLVLGGLLGIGVHFLRALWGLVSDNADGWTYLPLRLGLRIGASRLLWVSTAWTAVVLVALAFTAESVGLSQ